MSDATRRKAFAGTLCLLLPALLIWTNWKLLDCEGLYRVFPSLLSLADILLHRVSLIALVGIPPGIVLLFSAYAGARRGKGATKLRVAVECILILLSVLFGLSIVLASLSTARNLEPNGRVQSALNNLSLQSEIYFEKHAGYTDMCTNDPNIARMITSINREIEGHGLLCRDRASEISCRSDNDYYITFTRLPLVTQSEYEYYCVDSTGFRGKILNPSSGSTCTE